MVNSPQLKTRALKLWREWVRSLLLTVLVITSFRSAIADWNDVPTGSMKPTILEGDRIVVNKVAYDLKVPYTTWRLISWDGPARGDIVVLREPSDGTRLVKRVVGLPGDTIAMVNNHLIVNGEQVSYEALDPALMQEVRSAVDGSLLAWEGLGAEQHSVMLTPGCASRKTFDSTRVPEDSYFVLGDNRDNSLDSRYFGSVLRSRIVGRATAVAASVDPDRRYVPRWKRFFQALK